MALQLIHADRQTWRALHVIISCTLCTEHIISTVFSPSKNEWARLPQICIFIIKGYSNIFSIIILYSTQNKIFWSNCFIILNVLHRKSHYAETSYTGEKICIMANTMGPQNLNVYMVKLLTQNAPYYLSRFMLPFLLLKHSLYMVELFCLPHEQCWTLSSTDWSF
jgi:hypothetical protein